VKNIFKRGPLNRGSLGFARDDEKGKGGDSIKKWLNERFFFDALGGTAGPLFLRRDNNFPWHQDPAQKNEL